MVNATWLLCVRIRIRIKNSSHVSIISQRRTTGWKGKDRKRKKNQTAKDKWRRISAGWSEVPHLITLPGIPLGQSLFRPQSTTDDGVPLSTQKERETEHNTRLSMRSRMTRRRRRESAGEGRHWRKNKKRGVGKIENNNNHNHNNNNEKTRFNPSDPMLPDYVHPLAEVGDSRSIL